MLGVERKSCKVQPPGAFDLNTLASVLGEINEGLQFTITHRGRGVFSEIYFFGKKNTEILLVEDCHIEVDDFSFYLVARAEGYSPRYIPIKGIISEGPNEKIALKQIKSAEYIPQIIGRIVWGLNSSRIKDIFPHPRKPNDIIVEIDEWFKPENFVLPKGWCFDNAPSGELYIREESGKNPNHLWIVRRGL